MTGQIDSKRVSVDGRTRSRRVRHHLEWWLLHTLMAMVRRGDLATAYARVHSLSWPLRQLLRSEWRWTHFNLRLVYGPNLTATQRQRLAAMAFENIVCSHVDSMRVTNFHYPGLGSERPFQPLYEAFSRGRGAILCGTHLGSWEVALKLLADKGFPLGIVYRHANNPLSEQEFIAARVPYGAQWIRRDEPRKIMRVLQEKRVLVLMTDINQRQDGIPAPFLGIPAMCPVGVARLAGRFQCPVVAGICLREGSPGQLRFHFEPPIEPLARRDDPEALVAMTTAINDRFAPWIHAYAEQYNWLHARWRSRPDGTLWDIRTPQAAETLLMAMDAARTTPYPPLSERVQRLLA